LSLTFPDGEDLQKVSAELATELKAVGINVANEPVDTKLFQDTVLKSHNYDLLLYNLRLDNDYGIFSYWHSSQIGQRGLNLANYTNPAVDVVANRIKVTTDQTVVKDNYARFFTEWKKDLPAVPLYTVNKNLVYRGNLKIPMTKVINGSYLYCNIEDWTINTKIAPLAEQH
jgi:ABC-type transport system substrate-binding protein